MKKSSLFFLIYIALFTITLNSGQARSFFVYSTESSPSPVVSESLNKASQSEVNTATSSVKYTLPYPGILPDHPLYPLKKIRDKILDFLIRDPVKRIEFYLLMSDKRYAMGIQLTERKKYDLALETIEEAEVYFARISQELNKVKTQGRIVSKEKLLILKQAEEKHKEVVENLQKNSPKDMSKQYGNILVNIEKNFTEISNYF